MLTIVSITAAYPGTSVLLGLRHPRTCARALSRQNKVQFMRSGSTSVDDQYGSLVAATVQTLVMSAGKCIPTWYHAAPVGAYSSVRALRRRGVAPLARCSAPKANTDSRSPRHAGTSVTVVICYISPDRLQL